VKLVVHEENGKAREPTTTILGRLLGVCTDEQGEKILTRSSVGKKIHTRQSVPLEKVADAMHDIFSKNQSKNYGRLIVAIKEIEGHECWSRKLFITSPITMAVSEVFGPVNKAGEIEIMCEDESYITVEEIKCYITVEEIK
jgi:hypothetical protein